MSCQFLRSFGRILFTALLAAGALALADAAAFAQGPMHASLPNGPEDLWQGSRQNAQRKAHPVINPQYDEPDLFQPFVDPLSFDSDFQLFAPSDLSNYGGPPPVNTGWYISYGRETVNMSMPDATNGGDPFARPFDGEWLWGNRWDGGYMTQDNHGWNVTYASVTTGLLLEDGDLGIRLKSIYHSLELCKTFRRPVKGYGGYLEPYFGVRYIYMSDTENDNSPVGNGAVSEFEQKMQNQMIGGQIGCRYRVRKGRWNLSTDMKIFAGENFQFANVSDTDTLLGTTRTNDSFDEFTPIGEIRMECAYEITRDISLKAGWGLTHIVRGVLRADTAPFETNPNNPNNNLTDQLILVNDQDLTLVGATFGIEYNR